MFKNLRDVDFDSNISTSLSVMFKSNRILRRDITSPIGSDAVALEGIFWDNKEEKIKKFKDLWERHREWDIDGAEKMISEKNSLANKMQSDVELFKNKLANKKLELQHVMTHGLSYTDIISGLEATIALPEFIQKIFGISPSEIFKNDNVIYIALKNLPTVIKKGFVVDWDNQLTFRPEYHYRNGSKVHENEYVEKLGYNENNIHQVIAHIESSIQAYHKLALMIADLKKHYDEYESLGVNAISSGENSQKYWDKLICLTHITSPLWYEGTAYSLRGFTEKALVVIKEIAARY